MLREVQVTESAADSVQGPGALGGLADTAVTAKVFFDLTQWAGRTVIIQISGDAFYRFAHAVGDTLDTTTVVRTAEGGTPTAATASIAGRLFGPGEAHRVVPRPAPSATPGANDAKVGLLISSVTGSAIEVRVSAG